MYIYIYIYLYMCVCVYMCVYVCVRVCMCEREKEKDILKCQIDKFLERSSVIRIQQYLLSNNKDQQ